MGIDRNDFLTSFFQIQKYSSQPALGTKIHFRGGAACLLNFFFIAENREGHARVIEQFGKGNCDFLASVVVRPHGAYPEKVLKFFSFFFISFTVGISASGARHANFHVPCG